MESGAAGAQTCRDHHRRARPQGAVPPAGRAEGGPVVGMDVVLYRTVEEPGPGRRRVSHVAVDVLPDPDDVLADLLARVRGQGRTPLLDRADPVGEFIVPASRASRLLAELPHLAAAARDAREVGHVRDLARLARRCHPDGLMELRLEGD